MQVSLCEADWIKDTLVGAIHVLDATNSPLPFTFYDSGLKAFMDSVVIYPGYLGYIIYSEAKEQIHSIQLEIKGDTIEIYRHGDDIFEPLPFKQRLQLTPEISGDDFS